MTGFIIAKDITHTWMNKMCMYAHMHARTHTCACTDAHMSAHTHTYTHTHIHSHTHRHRQTHTYTVTHIHRQTHMHACTHAQTHTQKRVKRTCHSYQNHTINTRIPPFKQENIPLRLLALVLQEKEECRKARLGVCIYISNPFGHEKHQVSRYNFFFFFFFLSVGGGLLSYKHFSLSLEHHQDKFLCTY